MTDKRRIFYAENVQDRNTVRDTEDAENRRLRQVRIRHAVEAGVDPAHVGDSYWSSLVRPYPIGMSRVIHEHLRDGVVRSISCIDSELIWGRRASGRAFSHWTPKQMTVVERTKSGMLLKKSVGDMGTRHTVRREVLTDPSIVLSNEMRFGANNSLSREERTASQEAWDASMLESFGPVDPFDVQFPLLAGLNDRRKAIGSHLMAPYFRTDDVAQVGRAIFGARNYRKPMAAEILRLQDPALLTNFAQFRGLVPPEWIIDALRQQAASPAHRPPFWARREGIRALRACLAATPQPVLRRILREIQDDPETLRTVNDVIRTYLQRGAFDRADVSAALARIGQRNIRSTHDWEAAMLRVIPYSREDAPDRIDPMEVEYHREEKRIQACALLGREITWERWKRIEGDEDLHAEMEAARERNRTIQQRLDDERRRREQAEREAERELARARETKQQTIRRQWCEKVGAAFDGADICGMTAVVATNDSQMREWSQVMRNCIDGYIRDIGRHVFIGLYDGDEVKVNIQVVMNEVQDDDETVTGRLSQVYGPHNSPVARDVLVAVEEIGIPIGVGYEVDTFVHRMNGMLGGYQPRMTVPLPLCEIYDPQESAQPEPVAA